MFLVTSNSQYHLIMATIFSKIVAGAIRRAFQCKKVGVAVMGMEVPHAHIHLIPINQEKDMIFTNPKQQLTPEEFVAVAESIAREMK